MAQKPGIPKGTRDFSPAEVAKRQYIISAIKHHFETFGFQPIETPSFENSDTLMGKYGEEGDRLIFKILNSGEYFKPFKDIIKSYLVVLYGAILIDIAKGKSDQDLKDKLDQFLSFDFIEKIIERINKVSPSSKFYNFYSNALNDSIRDEIKTYLDNDFGDFIQLLKAFENKKEIEITNNSFLDRIAYTTAGRFFENIEEKDITKHISEKALRYDLTVPFARYVVMHQNEIEFPFKRYQIQPVWRADRPQKGRFREFYQCDADVVGSTSLWQEVELVQLYDNVFTSLGLNGATIKINNRKILSGIAEVIGAKDKLIDFTVALDKLDKIGEDGVKKEMLEKGITAEAIEKVQPLFSFEGSIDEKLAKLTDLLSSSEEGMKGVEELRFICDNVTEIGLGKSILDLDVTLARGLNYYTGAILEVTAPKEVAMGSIGGGGRYDDLTGIFGLKNMSGVGISFGLDRIYLVLEELNLFPDTVTEATKVLFLNFGNKEALYAMRAIKQLREKGIKAEMYPDAAKIGKQFQHADKRGIPFAVLAGDEEMNSGRFTLKDLTSGEQQAVTLEELINKIQ
jgi:histidyl-tRNA synthetase